MASTLMPDVDMEAPDFGGPLKEFGRLIFSKIYS